MGKITIEENKRLRLKNVIGRLYVKANVMTMNDDMQKFVYDLQVHNVATVGPLIMHNIETTMNAHGQPEVTYRLLVQTQGSMTPIEHTEFVPEIIVDNCLFVHYQGTGNDLRYATTKLDIHIWEEDLLTNGQQYMVYINNDPEHSVIDIFRPIER